MAAETNDEIVGGSHSPEGSGDEIPLDSPVDDASDQGSEQDGLAHFATEEDTADGQDPRAKVLSVLELEALFQSVAPDLTSNQLHSFREAYSHASIIQLSWIPLASLLPNWWLA